MESKSREKETGVEMFRPKPDVPPKDLFIDEDEWNFYQTGYIRDLSDDAKWKFSERIIMSFWWASQKDAWEYFDINRSLQWMYDFFGEFVHDWYHQHIDAIKQEEELYDGIISKNEFEDLHDRMDSTLKQLERMIDKGLDKYTLQEKIEMFDEIIHRYHHSGYIFKIQQLREQFERWYL